MKQAIVNAELITEGKIISGASVVFEDGIICGLTKEKLPEDLKKTDLKGNYLAPGFFDIHCHGGAGGEFIDGTEEAVIKALDIHKKGGTRFMLPTISACNVKTLDKALCAIKEVIPRAPVEIPGVHIEGPYFSKEMCGAQDLSLIKAPDESEYIPILEKYGDIIRRWSYAPELDKDNRFLDALTKYGVVPSIGHSSAEYDDVMRAYAGGAKLITHLYSCTSTVTRYGGFRHLGIIESAYLNDGIYVEAIGDGCHLPPELLRLIVKIKKSGKVALITDAIRFAGLDGTDNIRGGTENVPFIIEDGVAKLADRSAFAGSIATMDVLLKKTVNAGISLENTVRMMTEIPAKAVEIPKIGKIKKGYKAVFTAFDKNLNIPEI